MDPPGDEGFCGSFSAMSSGQYVVIKWTSPNVGALKLRKALYCGWIRSGSINDIKAFRIT